MMVRTDGLRIASCRLVRRPARTSRGGVSQLSDSAPAMHTSFVVASLALASALPAQACSSLSISGGAPGSNIDIAVSGAPANGLAVLVVSQQAGSTVVSLPMGQSLLLGVAEPFFPVPIGQTDASGAASLQLPVPASLAGQLQLQAQAVGLGFSFPAIMLQACASNVVPVTIG